LFEKLCEEIRAEHKSLILHTDMHGLSRRNVLTQLEELCEEVVLFLKGKTTLTKNVF